LKDRSYEVAGSRINREAIPVVLKGSQPHCVTVAIRPPAVDPRERALHPMPQQPEPISTTFAANPAPSPGLAPVSAPFSGSDRDDSFVVPVLPVGKPHPDRIPRWLEEAELLLRVVLRIYIGLVIFYAPWSGQVLTFFPWSRVIWEQNPLFLQFPMLGIIAANGAVRGIVSGLGLLNLWFALQDAMRGVQGDKQGNRD